MPKTSTTIFIEKKIYEATRKQGVFGCFEVTIGWYGKERVDYITYDTRGIWRCYEIKTSKSDFHSKSHNTFVGHFNYYAITKELYEQIKHEIPKHIGVYVESICVKKAQKQKLKTDEQILKNSMIRSLYREAEKQFKGKNPNAIESLNKKLNSTQKELEKYKTKYLALKEK